MIRLENVTKSFGANTLLHPLSAQVKKNEVIGIVGRSGGGKSTLLRCINYLTPPSSGTVTIDGTRLSEQNAGLMRQKVGMVFQQFHLFPHLSALDNITLAPIKVRHMPAHQAEALARQLLKKVGLADKADSKPARLSGGQKQRVAIARALAMQPDILLFDEPTSALDPQSAQEVIEVIQSVVQEGITSLIVTHNLGLLKNVADRIWFMDHGTLIEDTPASIFFTHPATEQGREFMQHPEAE